MESLTLYHANLEKLRGRATRLAADAGSLASLFAEEANRLHREDEASRLAALSASILGQLEQERCLEAAGSYGESKARLTSSFIRLGVGLAIRAAAKDKELSALSDHLLKDRPGKRPYGNVSVYIGPKGIPGDVGVVSISRLARESKREETLVIEELSNGGDFLPSGEAFSLLMDKLINDVRGGRLSLPIPLEKLRQIQP